ncbi:MAG: tetratricopeptide repeat protein [Myxococcota bacterium]
MADEYRRRGRPDEVGRIAEMALRLRPDDVGLLLDAAAARVEAGEHKRALAHLQLAFGHAPREPRTLDLLARALEGVGQADKALKVLSELARIAADRADAAAEADALRRAVKIAPEDGELQARLAGAEDKLSRMERRLTQLVLAQPATEGEVRAVVRAEVYLRYGFVDRAENALREALAATPDALSLLSAMAEVEVTRRRNEDAVRWMERILPRAGAEAAAVIERIGVLRGIAPVDVAPEPVDMAPEAVDELDEDMVTAPPATARPAVETSEMRGDRLVKENDLAGAMMAYRDALGEDPLNDGILVKIAGLRERARALAAAPPAPAPALADEDDAFADFAPLDDGTFTEVDPESLDEVEPAPFDIDEVRSLVAVGMWSDALALLDGVPTLDAAVLRAQAVRGQGDTPGALDVLREAVNDALETDPAYRDALFELSALYTATGKPRAAVRLLEELRDLDPSYRVTEVEARLRGLQKLLK